MKKNQTQLILALCLTLLLCGCGKKNHAADEPSANTPWNNGHYAIMESEQGFYSNHVIQNLHFHDKASGKDIYLCPKPECTHDGSDSCTATYRRLRTVNTVMYEDKLYILTLEKSDRTAGYALYCATSDGSALDKVGTVFSAEYAEAGEVFFNNFDIRSDINPAFIIHKGYAYIPFYLATKSGMAGFVNGGIIKMNLKNGKTEQIYTMKQKKSGFPWNLRACEDYVYFDKINANPGRNELGTFRYNIQDGSIAPAFSEELFPEQIPYADAVTADRLYRIAGGDSRFDIIEYDSSTLEELGVLFSTEKMGTLICYQNWVFFCATDELALYSRDGKKLGASDYRLPGQEQEYSYSPNFTSVPNINDMLFKISGDKLYGIFYQSYDHAEYYDTYFVYSCPIGDIIAQKGAWSYEYAIYPYYSPSPDI